MYNARSFYRCLSKTAEGLKNPGLNWTRMSCEKLFTKTIERKYSAIHATIKKLLGGMS